ncbi:MAG: hypothetical protein KF845_12890 [Cyclobacteriaceae bacterium]|nr:hypothetical protein [Cyclobacteriaceae bacterium]
MKSRLPLFFLLLISACTSMENAELTTRATFIKTYSGIRGIEAAAAELTPDGFIVLGNMTITRDSVLTVVFKTDKRGNRTTPIQYFPGGSGNAIKALPDNQGYLVVGERIKVNPQDPETSNIDIYEARMLHVNNNLDVVNNFYRADVSGQAIITDYKAVTLTITPDEKIVVLGSYQGALNTPERPYIEIFDANLTSETFTEYAALERSYKNAKSIHHLNENLIWASAIALEQQNFDFSYASVPVVKEGSVFTRYTSIGENTPLSQSLRVDDIQPFKFQGLGFGVVGTRSNPNGTNANIIFFRTDSQGNIRETTVNYFDAISGETTETTSSIQDYGTAITGTSDGGFVIAGHYVTNTQQGNGLNDIVLIKVDLNGNLIWMKTFGGTGSETVSTIRETDDYGLLVCGTNVIGGVPSIFLIKTDANGELKN